MGSTFEAVALCSTLAMQIASNGQSWHLCCFCSLGQHGISVDMPDICIMLSSDAAYPPATAATRNGAIANPRAISEANRVCRNFLLRIKLSFPQ